MSNIFKLCPTHFSWGAKKFLGGASPPLRPTWLRAWVRAATNIPKNSKAKIMLALCPGRCLLHRKGIENKQKTIFGNVKFAVSQ